MPGCAQWCPFVHSHCKTPHYTCAAGLGAAQLCVHLGRGICRGWHADHGEHDARPQCLARQLNKCCRDEGPHPSLWLHGLYGSQLLCATHAGAHATQHGEQAPKHEPSRASRKQRCAGRPPGCLSAAVVVKNALRLFACVPHQSTVH
jgi:hypothetical protein